MLLQDTTDHMPWASEEDIRAIIWFTRIFPLAVLVIVGVFYIVGANTPGWLPGQLGV
jgi:hypothetical protein